MTVQEFEQQFGNNPDYFFRNYTHFARSVKFSRARRLTKNRREGPKIKKASPRTHGALARARAGLAKRNSKRPTYLPRLTPTKPE